MSSLDIIVAVPSGAGWVPVHAMAELLARYTGGTVHLSLIHISEPTRPY